MRALLVALAFNSLVLIVGCTQQPQRVVPDHDVGPSMAEFAIVEQQARGADVVSIRQGDRVYFFHEFPDYDSKEIWLKPGKYTINYWVWVRRTSPGQRTAEIVLKAGHRYAAKWDTCTWSSEKHSCGLTWALQTAGFSWFEDLTTGELVDGSKTEPVVLSG